MFRPRLKYRRCSPPARTRERTYHAPVSSKPARKIVNPVDHFRQGVCHREFAPATDKVEPRSVYRLAFETAISETLKKTLIAEDEAAARARLRLLLGSHADIEIVGEAETGFQTMELAGTLRPDLILLNIRMPGCIGLDIAASLPEPRPIIVFCTAYDEHAMDAFELAAVNYLLKPVNRARIATALNRVRASKMDKAPRLRLRGTARFLVRSGAKYLVMDESRVSHVFSGKLLFRRW